MVRWCKKLLLALLAAMLGALAIEGCTRAWDAISGEPYSPAAVSATLREIAGAAANELPVPSNIDFGGSPKEKKGEILHPYVGFDIEKSLRQIPHLVTMEHRHRADRYEIYVLGGSVAGIFSHFGAGELIRQLKQDPRWHDKRVAVRNFARPAFKQPQQVTMLAYLLSLGLRPDAVINLDGFNEVAIGNLNATIDMHPVYPAARQWLPKATLGPSGLAGLAQRSKLVAMREELAARAEFALRHGLENSAVLGTWVLNTLQRSRATLAEASDKFLSELGGRRVNPTLYGPPFKGNTKQAVRQCVVAWTQSSLSLQGMCQARSILYLHVLQPTLWDTGSKQLTAQERHKSRVARPWIDGVHIGYPMMRENGKALAQRGVNFVDASQVFRRIKQTLYIDACHFNRKGNLILGQTIGHALVECAPKR